MELGEGIPQLLHPVVVMKRGLVIGKFMPIHTGHIALINFAASLCDELIVSMSYTPTDPIDASLRFSWIEEIFKNNNVVLPAMVEDNFDNENLDLEERTKIWAAFIRKRFPPIDVIYSSEEYGAPFAKNLGKEHTSFDLLRKKIPISATRIRENPFQHWEFIPDVVRPYFVKKICFYGPESTGKSFMAKRMVEKYKTELVPEVARELIANNEFSVDDIIRIGQAHHERILEKTKTANKILMCDTDAITTQIYSEYYLHEVPPILHVLENKVKYDLYFLFDIDVPWIEDGLRDLGHLRKEMFLIFKEALDKRNITYVVVSGDWQQREMIVTQAIDKLLR